LCKGGEGRKVREREEKGRGRDEKGKRGVIVQF